MRRLNKSAKHAFYSARMRKGDVARLSETTGLTERYIYYVMSGERNVNQNLANAMYNISRRRMKNSELLAA